MGTVCAGTWLAMGCCLGRSNAYACDADPGPRRRRTDGLILHGRHGCAPCRAGCERLAFRVSLHGPAPRGRGQAPAQPGAETAAELARVYTEVRRHVAGKLVIGGKSMGGRMASLLADELGADGLVCLGYPFYAVGKPEKPRVAHLAGLKAPTLIVQGERDALGNRAAVQGYDLSPSIEVMWLAAGDHDLKPLKASGCSHEQHLEAAAVQVAQFLGAC